MKKIFGGIKFVFDSIFRWIVRTALWLYCLLIYRYKAIGKENIPKDGAVIICGNHRTFLDAPLIVISNKRFVHFMAKDELKKNPLVRFVAYLFQVVYVKRNEKDVGALKQSLKRLKNGEVLGIFPEGTRHGFDKGEGKIKGGAAYLAIKTNATIVPVGIYGGERPFKRIYVHYGEPVNYKEMYKDEDEKLITEKANEDLKNRILELTKEN